MGGLGLQSAKGGNTALLAKLNWRFHSEDNAPWVKVLKLKYGNRQRLSSKNEAKLPGSPIWKGLKKGEHVFKEGMKWIPGHESNLDFWLDSWSDLGPLRSIIHGPIPLESTNLKVKDVFLPYGWNWSAIPFDLPSDIKESIKAVPLPIASRSGDRLAWKRSSNGDFSSKGAYLLATKPSEAVLFPSAWIWKLTTLPKIQMFLWQCMHKSVGVRCYLVERGLNIPTICPYVTRSPKPSIMLFETTQL